MKELRFTLLIALALATAFCAPAQAARSNFPKVGVGDNGPLLFQNPNYQALHTTISRKIIAWDYYKHPDEVADLDAWIAGAKSSNVEPLISFGVLSTRPETRRLISVEEFRQTMYAFRARYPEVMSISPWNEQNHPSQPTSAHPKRAAEYYNAAKQICPACKIVAADLLDSPNIWKWLRQFKRYARSPKIWGIHSYLDSNHSRPWKKSITRKFISQVRGEIWITEVGGIVAFGLDRPYDEARANNAVATVLRYGRKSPRIKRVYLYSWFGTDHSITNFSAPFSWDSALTSIDGELRPSYWTLRYYTDRFPH